jgi:hypothetical protein
VACNVVFRPPINVRKEENNVTGHQEMKGRSKTTLQTTNKCKGGGKQRYRPPISVRKEGPVTLFSSFLTSIGGL